MKPRSSIENEPPFTASSFLPRILASSFGSIVTAVTVTPLEVVKVRQQSLSIPRYRSTASTKICPSCGTFLLNNGLMECLVSKTSVPHFKTPVSEMNMGILPLLSHIFRTEGYSGIYAGLAPTLVMSVPNTVLYFTAYDEIVSRCRRSESESGWNHIAVPMIGGSCARLLASFVTSPLELVRTRRAIGGTMRGAAAVNHGLWMEMRTMVRREGFLSLYQGLTPTLWRDAPFSAIYWLCLEYFKRNLRALYFTKIRNTRIDSSTSIEDQRCRTMPPLVEVSHAFLSGAGAGMIAAFCTTPFDVVKTRRQVTSMGGRVDAKVCDHGGAKPLHASQYNMRNTNAAGGGVFHQMEYIVQTEGIKGLWRGNQVRMIKVAPACAIMISCYELGKRIFS